MTGFVLLGVVASVGDLDLMVSLPSNMVGRVAITEVSDAVTAAVERAAADAPDADAEEAGEGEGENEGDGAHADDAAAAQVPDLNQLFAVGQTVVCTVLEATNEGEGNKHAIQLSLNPRRVNAEV